MTPDDIVALWREHKEVHAFARAVEAIAKAEEREACAKLIESRKTGANVLMDAGRDMEARAIRARGHS